MSAVTQDVIADLRTQYSECFACGQDNPIGLHLDGFEVSNGVVTASFDPRPHYRGFDDLLHGGIAATALDEIMAWTAILAEGVLAVTLTLELRFNRPIAPQGMLRATGTVSKRSGSRLQMRGELSRNDDVLAEAAGLFLVREDLTAGRP